LFVITKKLGQFGQSVQKFRLLNTLILCFNITLGQMTKMSQRKKTSYNSLTTEGSTEIQLVF